MHLCYLLCIVEAYCIMISYENFSAPWRGAEQVEYATDTYRPICRSFLLTSLRELCMAALPQYYSLTAMPVLCGICDFFVFVRS